MKSNLFRTKRDIKLTIYLFFTSPPRENKPLEFVILIHFSTFSVIFFNRSWVKSLKNKKVTHFLPFKKKKFFWFRGWFVGLWRAASFTLKPKPILTPVSYASRWSERPAARFPKAGNDPQETTRVKHRRIVRLGDVPESWNPAPVKRPNAIKHSRGLFMFFFRGHMLLLLHSLTSCYEPFSSSTGRRHFPEVWNVPRRWTDPDGQKEWTPLV